jgi:hypothetical protein
MTASSPATAGSGQVAFAKNGMWVNLRPQPDGTITRERLVNMSRQNTCSNGEPNVSITPDGKWVVFRRTGMDRHTFMRLKLPGHLSGNHD